METGLTGKVAMISGGSKGLGKEIAFQLAREGVKLSICARNEENLKSFVDELSKEDAEVIYTAGDMKDNQHIKQFVMNTVDAFGKVDILVNNAGSAPVGNFYELEDDVWFDSWKLKFMGYVRLSREVMPHMKTHNQGRIINVIGGWGKYPMQNYMVGGHINAALLNTTKLLAYEGAKHNILVNGINPGPINTGRWDQMITTLSSLSDKVPEEFEKDLLSNIALGRPGKAEEVANLVTFLASERSSYITGAVIPIDGGMMSSI